MVAMAATVMAVPSPMTKVATTPVQNSPCASAKTSTSDGTRARPQAHGDDGGESALPSARAGELLRLRRMRVSPGRSMVVVIMIVRVAVAALVDAVT